MKKYNITIQEYRDIAVQFGWYEVTSKNKQEISFVKDMGDELIRLKIEYQKGNVYIKYQTRPVKVFTEVSPEKMGEILIHEYN